MAMPRTDSVQRSLFAQTNTCRLFTSPLTYMSVAYISSPHVTAIFRLHTMLFHFLIASIISLLLLTSAVDAVSSCPTTSDGAAGTITVTGCTVDATYVLDVGSLVSALYDGGSRPTVFHVNIGDIVAVSASPVFFQVTNASAFSFSSIPVNVSIRSFVATDTATFSGVVFDIILPTQASSVDVGRVEITSSANLLPSSCGYAALCVSTSTASSVQSISFHTVIATLVQLVGQSVASGTTWAGVRFMSPTGITSWVLSNTNLQIGTLWLNASIATALGNLHGVEFPSTPTVVSSSSHVGVNTNCSTASVRCGAVLVLNTQDFSSVTAVYVPSITITSGTISIVDLNMTLQRAADGVAVTYVRDTARVLHFDKLSLQSSSAQVTISGITFADIQPSAPTTVSGRTIVTASLLALVYAANVTVNGSGTLFMSNNKMDVSWEHQASTVVLATLRNVTLTDVAGGAPVIHVSDNVMTVRLHGNASRAVNAVELWPQVDAHGASITVEYTTLHLGVVGPPDPVTVPLACRVVIVPSAWVLSSSTTLVVQSNTLHTLASSVTVATIQNHMLAATANLRVDTASSVKVLNSSFTTDAAGGTLLVSQLAVALFNGTLVVQDTNSLVLVQSATITASTTTASADVSALSVAGTTTLGAGGNITVADVVLSVTVTNNNIVSASVASFAAQVQCSTTSTTVLWITGTTLTVTASGFQVDRIGLYVASVAFTGISVSSGVVLTRSSVLYVQQANWSATLLQHSNDQGLVFVGGATGNGSAAVVTVSFSTLSMSMTAVGSNTAAAILLKGLGGSATNDAVPRLVLDHVHAIAQSSGAVTTSSTAVVEFQFNTDVLSFGGFGVLNSTLEIPAATSTSTGVSVKGSVGTLTTAPVVIGTSNIWVALTTATSAQCRGVAFSMKLVVLATWWDNKPNMISVHSANISASSPFVASGAITAAVYFAGDVTLYGGLLIFNSTLKSVGPAKLFGWGDYTANWKLYLDSRWNTSDIRFRIERNIVLTDRPAGSSAVASIVNGIAFYDIAISAGVRASINDNIFHQLSSNGADSNSGGQGWYCFQIQQFTIDGETTWTSENVVWYLRNTAEIYVSAAYVNNANAFSVGTAANNDGGSYLMAFSDNNVTVTVISNSGDGNGGTIATSSIVSWYHYFSWANSTLTFENNVGVINCGSKAGSPSGIYVDY
ncbi:membrane-associated protein, putative, partial [Bodo saltans]